MSAVDTVIGVLMLLSLTLGNWVAYKKGYGDGYYDGYFAEEDSDDGQPAQGD